MTVLNSSQVAFFEREGYLVVDNFFDDADLQPLIDELSEEIDRLAREMVRSGEISDPYEGHSFERRLMLIHKESDKVFNAIKAGKLSGAGVFSLLSHPKLLDAAEQFCGPEIIASSVYRVRPKLPGDRLGAIPWHQDSGYFEPYCDNSLIVTTWIPLVDATEERGCLWIMPRSHRSGICTHTPHPGKVFLEITPDHLPPGEPVCAPVRKGGIIFMTNKTPHGSVEINRSDSIRWSIDFRYQSASLPTNAFTPINEEPAGSPSAGPPPACYPPERDLLIRSRLHPEKVCSNAEQFKALRVSWKPRVMTDRWNLKALSDQNGWRGFSETYNVNAS